MNGQPIIGNMRVADKTSEAMIECILMVLMCKFGKQWSVSVEPMKREYAEAKAGPKNVADFMDWMFFCAL